MQKNKTKQKKQKKPGQILIWQQIPWLKKLNYFNKVYCQNSTQTTTLKPNQTLFDRTYSNLTSLFLVKKIKVFQWLLKSKLMTKVKSNNGNETKSDIFPLDIFKSDVISFLIKKI